MYADKIEIDVSKDSADSLGTIVCDRWNEAARWQSIEQCGKHSVKTVLRQCYEQVNGILTPCDQELVDNIGVDAYINLSELKSGALISWMRDLLTNTSELPFTISPTPIPDLSKAARQEVLDRMKRQIFMEGFDGDFIDLAKSLKEQVLRGERDYADAAAAKMSLLIKDQCYEGNFRTSLSSFIDDIARYPFAVFHGPVPMRVTRMNWSGNRIVAKDETIYGCIPTSVWDVSWSPDSPDTQRGTGVNVRERITRQQLFQCLTMPSYIQGNVEEVLRRCEIGNQHYNWLSENPEQQSTQQSMWVHGGATVEVIKHYGFFSGRELKKYGITGIDDSQFYNATVSVIGGLTIQAFINPNPNANLRPIHTTSFERKADRIPGSSICQRIRDVERCYMAALRFAMRNAKQSSEPITEADYRRLAKFMSPQDIGSLIPGMVYPVDSDMSGGSGSAFRFHDVPSNTGVYLNLMNYFMDVADRVSQIPASIHGEPVGTGANRTVRGMAMLYGNALKPIQSGLANMDEHVFKPFGTMLYNYNMKYSKDESIKGDCLVQAQGSTGLLQKEVAKQTAMELLQVVSQVGAVAPEVIPPKAIQWAVGEVLKTTGVPAEFLVENTNNALPPPVQDGGLEPPQLPQIPDEGVI